LRCSWYELRDDDVRPRTAWARRARGGRHHGRASADRRARRSGRAPLTATNTTTTSISTSSTATTSPPPPSTPTPTPTPPTPPHHTTPSHIFGGADRSAALEQSVADLFPTPVGDMVLRLLREYLVGHQHRVRHGHAPRVGQGALQRGLGAARAGHLRHAERVRRHRLGVPRQSRPGSRRCSHNHLRLRLHLHRQQSAGSAFSRRPVSLRDPCGDPSRASLVGPCRVTA
jgi:hypothetical protein